MKTNIISVKLDDETKSGLTKLSEVKNISQSDMLRAIIKEKSNEIPVETQVIQIPPDNNNAIGLFGNDYVDYRMQENDKKWMIRNLEEKVVQLKEQLIEEKEKAKEANEDRNKTIQENTKFYDEHKRLSEELEKAGKMNIATKLLSGVGTEFLQGVVSKNAKKWGIPSAVLSGLGMAPEEESTIEDNLSEEEKARLEIIKNITQWMKSISRDELFNFYRLLNLVEGKPENIVKAMDYLSGNTQGNTQGNTFNPESNTEGNTSGITNLSDIDTAENQLIINSAYDNPESNNKIRNGLQILVDNTSEESMLKVTRKLEQKPDLIESTVQQGFLDMI